VKLSLTRLSRRVIDEARNERLLNPYARLSAAECRAKARAARQPDPPGIHCNFCGEVKASFEAPCPNDGPDWPHPRGLT